MYLTIEYPLYSVIAIGRLCEDALVKANGLAIKQIVSQQGCATLLTEAACHLPHYGVSDLKQILVAVLAYETENGSVCPLGQSRPIKVETYLRVCFCIDT
jgi:hypothetical protein